MLKKRIINNSQDLNRLDSKETYDSIVISLPVYRSDVLTPFNEKLTNHNSVEQIKKTLKVVNENLNMPGGLYIYGSPIQLIKIYENLPNELRFRYWIALDMLDSFEKESKTNLKHNHIGILMLIKGKGLPKLETKNTRVSYWACNACSKNIKDWGGKKHLMNIKGAGISDVWKDFYSVLNRVKDPDRNEITLNVIDSKKSAFKFKEDEMPKIILNRLLSLIDEPKSRVLHLNVKKSFIAPINTRKFKSLKRSHDLKPPKDLTNKVILGDSLKLMEKWLKKYPKGLFDLVFADPPYNLDKSYDVYDDSKTSKEYVEWCNKWLELSAKLTKPTGSIFILNIPEWALEHAKTLNKFAYLNNWIVWDALSMPKGKIMPAHYSLLYYTKSPKEYNFENLKQISRPEYCLRNKCIKNRKKNLNSLLNTENNRKQNNKVSASDVWWDIHRIKHKKDRDNHPCQLPTPLMDRIITTFSKPGDLIFDPFSGAGTTAISAYKNNRRYLTIEIDSYYKNITENKLAELKNNGYIARKTTNNGNGSKYTKKDLELKVQEYATLLGRKPALEEFINKFALDISEIEKLYEKPADVLKAGRISLLNRSY